MAPGEREHAAGVILVFVGDNDGAKGGGLHAQTRKARFGLAHRKPAVEQQARAAAFHHQRVARAAAADGSKAHGARSPAIRTYFS